MTYLMRRLVVDELQLRETFRIINKYLSNFDVGEVSIPNFSHYTQGGEHAIRLRLNYRDSTVVTKAVGILDQLVAEDDINEYLPDDWEDKNDVTAFARDYCVLAFKIVSEISGLNEFEDVTENNPLDGRFSICFFKKFFNQIGIDLRITQQDIENYCTNHIQTMVDHSIDAISEVEINLEDFHNPQFFMRFCHMFCNNLIVQPDILDGNGIIVQLGGENEFWEMFYLKNSWRYFSSDCLQRFCEELSE